jgi:hypothetical protein
VSNACWCRNRSTPADCRQLGLQVIEVQFGARSDRASIGEDAAIVYANKRAEVWGNSQRTSSPRIEPIREIIGDVVLGNRSLIELRTSRRPASRHTLGAGSCPRGAKSDTAAVRLFVAPFALR